MAIDLQTIASNNGGFAIRGATAGAHAGASVSSAGDVNGDGFEDYLIGAPYANVFIDLGLPGRSGAGVSFLVFGQGSGFGTVALSDLIFPSTAGFVVNGEEADDRSGISVSSAGDINGDGFDDLIIGAP